MKRVVLAVLAVMMVCSPSFAFFFDPVSTILDAASQAAVEEAKETPSLAFVKLVEVYNMMCEKQIEPNQIRLSGRRLAELSIP